MINIRPVSDLRNKYQEIEEKVLKEDEVVYLTKNGYGSTVMMSLEKYSNLMEEIKLEKELSENNESDEIEVVMDKIEELDNHNPKYLSNEDVFSNGRKIINGEK